MLVALPGVGRACAFTRVSLATLPLLLLHSITIFGTFAPGAPWARLSCNAYKQYCMQRITFGHTPPPPPPPTHTHMHPPPSPPPPPHHPPLPFPPDFPRTWTLALRGFREFGRVGAVNFFPALPIIFIFDMCDYLHNPLHMDNEIINFYRVIDAFTMRQMYSIRSFPPSWSSRQPK